MKKFLLLLMRIAVSMVRREDFRMKIGKVVNRKVKNYWLLLVLGLVVMSCSRDDYPQTIVGTWQTDHYHLKLQALGAASDNQKIEQNINWVVRADGTITVTELSTQNGTYTLSDDNKELFIEYPLSGDTNTWEIRRLNARTMKVVFVQQFTGGTATYRINFDRL